MQYYYLPFKQKPHGTESSHCTKKSLRAYLFALQYIKFEYKSFFWSKIANNEDQKVSSQKNEYRIIFPYMKIESKKERK